MNSGLFRAPSRISGLLRPWQPKVALYISRSSRRQINSDGRARTSGFWIPTGGITKKADKEDAHDLLVRAGFLRQAYSGIFHMLPLGLRVQEKLERLIDKHMQSLGASKVSLSSLSSQELWERSGRLKGGSEMFQFQDRKESRFLLAPTHEEEITTLVSGLVRSYKDLPLRVYQISRKYRDEARPRQGLLRGREFIMKDLYTFDFSVETAMETYEAVRQAYTRLFDELKIPYLVAAADSGNMGGNLSHEFHFVSPNGEDTVISCSHCKHAFNEEIADGRSHIPRSETEGKASEPSVTGVGVEQPPAIATGLWMAVSKDRRTLVRAWFPKYTARNSADPVEREINSHAVKAVAAAASIDLDASMDNPLGKWYQELQSRTTTGTEEGTFKVVDLYDAQVKIYSRPPLSGLPEELKLLPNDVEFARLDRFPGTDNGLNLTRVVDGDRCPHCGEGELRTQSAVELGHTFFLGTRYSDVLEATVGVEGSLLDTSEGGTRLVPMQMGCYGIGVSRTIATVAGILSDDRGLNWPRVIAPYEAVVIPTKGQEADAETVYDTLAAANIDAILDDREKPIGWKLGDADLVGYPVIAVVGRGWKQDQTVEVQCRRLGVREGVPVSRLSGFVQSLLGRL